MGYKPLTVIKIIQNAPCDDTYSDVIKFGSAGEQAAYFSGLAVRTCNNCSYQRVSNSVRGGRPAYTCRVPFVADGIYNCNYIMFQNVTFGSKWFYAFIRQINYVSPECTEIVYEIDSYQTYQFNYKVKPSLVEREHPVNDVLFANRQAENISDVPIAMNEDASTSVHALGDSSYCQVYATAHDSGLISCFQLKDNIFQGADTFPRPDKTDPDDVIKTLTGYVATNNLDKVVAIVTTPFKLSEQIAPVNWVYSMAESINGYTPRYKKCFNYPFNYLQVSDLSGYSISYLFERFTKQSVDKEGNISVQNNGAKFKISYFTGYPPSVKVMPIGYSELSYLDEAWDNAFVTANFPETNFSAGNFDVAILRGMLDLFKGSTKLLLGTVGTKGWDKASAIGSYNQQKGYSGGAALKTAGGAVEGSLKESFDNSGLGGIGHNFVSNLSSHEQSFYADRGNINNRLFNFKENRNFIVARQMSVTAEFAKRIDDYFDMYGYATNLVKVPNEDSRESWNYVKTNNVIVFGSMPVQDMANIKAMYNSGVRFWHTVDVGNYSLSNRDIKEVKE